jgi:hypothetical protein
VRPSTSPSLQPEGRRQPVPLPSPLWRTLSHRRTWTRRHPENSGRQDRLLNTTTPPRESVKDSSSLIAFHHGTRGVRFSFAESSAVLSTAFVPVLVIAPFLRFLAPPLRCAAMRATTALRRQQFPLQYSAVAMCCVEFSCEQDRSSLGSMTPCSAMGSPSSFQTHTHYLWCLQFRSTFLVKVMTCQEKHHYPNGTPFTHPSRGLCPLHIDFTVSIIALLRTRRCPSRR